MVGVKPSSILGVAQAHGEQDRACFFELSSCLDQAALGPPV